jgi:hypothetical protein
MVRGAVTPKSFSVALRGSLAFSVYKILGLTTARQAKGKTPAALQRSCRMSGVIPIDAGARRRFAPEVTFIVAAKSIAMNDPAIW